MVRSSLWLRWFLAAPLAGVWVAVLYLVYGGVERLGVGALTAIAGPVAAALAATGFVYIGRRVAPRFGGYVAFALTIGVFATAIFTLLLGSNNGFAAPPRWYMALLAIAAIAGAIYGYNAKPRNADAAPGHDAFAWMPHLVRWLVLIPLASAIALVVAFGISIPLALLHAPAELVRLANTPVSMAALVAAGAAIAPSHKKGVAVTLGIVAALVVAIVLFAGLQQATTAATLPIYVNQRPNEKALALTAWLDFLTSAGALAGIAVSVRAVSRAQRA
jgi:hypothetical protein